MEGERDKGASKPDTQDRLVDTTADVNLGVDSVRMDSSSLVFPAFAGIFLFVVGFHVLMVTLPGMDVALSLI